MDRFAMLWRGLKKNFAPQLVEKTFIKLIYVQERVIGHNNAFCLNL